jgi:hypothetical protein
MFVWPRNLLLSLLVFQTNLLSLVCSVVEQRKLWSVRFVIKLRLPCLSWQPTCASTLVRDLSSVTYVGHPFISLLPWRITCAVTVVRNRSSVMFASHHFYRLLPCRITCADTQARSHTNVTLASCHTPPHQWEAIQVQHMWYVVCAILLPEGSSTSSCRWKAVCNIVNWDKLHFPCCIGLVAHTHIRLASQSVRARYIVYRSSLSPYLLI